MLSAGNYPRPYVRMCTGRVRSRKTPMSVPVNNNNREAKKRCYPSNKSFTVTDTLAAVELHYLLDHTILRIVQAHEIVLDSVAGKFIHLAVCLTTGPKPLLKPALHIVRCRASSFK